MVKEMGSSSTMACMEHIKRCKSYKKENVFIWPRFCEISFMRLKICQIFPLFPFTSMYNVFVVGFVSVVWQK